MEDHTDGDRTDSELTNLSKSCILHSLHLLSPASGQDDSLSSAASVARINKFCKELYEAAQRKIEGKKRRSSTTKTLPERVTENLLDSDSLRSFHEGRLSADQLCEEIERNLSGCITDDFDHESLFRVCWKVYREKKRPDKEVIEFSRQHPVETDSCMYHLWLIFNAILPSMTKEMTTSVRCLDMIMKRLLDLCGHECSSQELVYGTTSEKLDYLGFLKAIANYIERFNLKSSLTCEVRGLYSVEQYSSSPFSSQYYDCKTPGCESRQ